MPLDPNEAAQVRSLQDTIDRQRARIAARKMLNGDPYFARRHYLDVMPLVASRGTRPEPVESLRQYLKGNRSALHPTGQPLGWILADGTFLSDNDLAAMPFDSVTKAFDAFDKEVECRLARVGIRLEHAQPDRYCPPLPFKGSLKPTSMIIPGHVAKNAPLPPAPPLGPCGRPPAA